MTFTLVISEALFLSEDKLLEAHFVTRTKKLCIQATAVFTLEKEQKSPKILFKSDTERLFLFYKAKIFWRKGSLIKSRYEDIFWKKSLCLGKEKKPYRVKHFPENGLKICCQISPLAVSANSRKMHFYLKKVFWPCPQKRRPSLYKGHSRYTKMKKEFLCPFYPKKFAALENITALIVCN